MCGAGSDGSEPRACRRGSPRGRERRCSLRAGWGCAGSRAARRLAERLVHQKCRTEAQTSTCRSPRVAEDGAGSCSPPPGAARRWRPAAARCAPHAHRRRRSRRLRGRSNNQRFDMSMTSQGFLKHPSSTMRSLTARRGEGHDVALRVLLPDVPELVPQLREALAELLGADGAGLGRAGGQMLMWKPRDAAAAGSLTEFISSLAQAEAFFVTVFRREQAPRGLL